MCAGVAADDFDNRRGDRSQKSFRETVGKFQAESVAITGSILNRDVAGPSGNLYRDDAACADERIEGFEEFGRSDALRNLVTR